MREGDFLVQIAMVTVGVAMVLGECFTDAVFSPADTRDPLYWEFTVTAATASYMSLGRHLFTQCACLSLHTACENWMLSDRENQYRSYNYSCVW